MAQRGEPASPATSGPMPLGLAGFGLTLFVAGVTWSGMIPEARENFALPLAMVFGMISLFAGLVEYRRDTFIATALGLLGAFWLSWGALQWMLQADFLTLGEDRENLLGTFFLGWTVVMALMVVTALTVNLAMTLVLAGAALTFVSLAIGYYGDTTDWINIGGWIGIVTAVITGYVVLAASINSTTHRTVLPMIDTRPFEARA